MLNRTLHLVGPPLMMGPDVTDAQRVLVKHGYPVAVDGVAGVETLSGARDAKWDLGYPDGAVVQTYGKILYGYLEGTRKVPASYARRAAERKDSRVVEKRQRARIVEYCLWAIENEPQISYFQGRPMEDLTPRSPRLKLLPRTADCSEFATDAHCWAGAPDPNGHNFDGGVHFPAYTGSMVDYMRAITRSMIQPGDLIVFGPGTGHHVVVALEAGYDPYCASHGSNRGPLRIRLSDEAKWQPSPIRPLRLPAWADPAH